MDYFVNAAPLLKWNAQRKHFNVIEGHHRLVFLMVEGLRKVPVKISRKDFDTWANRQIFYECREFIKKKKLMKDLSKLDIKLSTHEAAPKITS